MTLRSFIGFFFKGLARVAHCAISGIDNYKRGGEEVKLSKARESSVRTAQVSPQSMYFSLSVHRLIN